MIYPSSWVSWRCSLLVFCHWRLLFLFKGILFYSALLEHNWGVLVRYVVGCLSIRFCLVFFLWLDHGYGFGEGDYRGRIYCHHIWSWVYIIKMICCHWWWPWSPSSRRCLSDFSTLKLSFYFPLSIVYSLERSHYARTTLQEWGVTVFLLEATWSIYIMFFEFLCMGNLSHLIYLYLYGFMDISFML